MPGLGTTKNPIVCAQHKFDCTPAGATAAGHAAPVVYNFAVAEETRIRPYVSGGAGI
jgi:hypothetical protein